MIYFSNVEIDTPHMAFFGRWTPFHKGHTAIIEKKLTENPEKPVLILIRSTNYDAYVPTQRAELIKLWMLENKIKGTVMIVPDIEGVYWGRGVGYKTEMVDVDKEIQEISATKIREGIKNGDENWNMNLSTKNGSDLIGKRTAEIVQNGLVIWLTGAPCAGKTTISNALFTRIKETFPHLRVQQLDGDVMRDTPIAEGIGFSPEDRALHIRRMGQLAKMFANHGILVIAAFVSPDGDVREEIKQDIGPDRFVEVYVKADQKTRIERDTKGMYKKAMAGEITNFTGYNAPYEEPIQPDVTCDTDQLGIDANRDLIFKKLFEV